MHLYGLVDTLDGYILLLSVSMMTLNTTSVPASFMGRTFLSGWMTIFPFLYFLILNNVNQYDNDCILEISIKRLYIDYVKNM
jgi:hypothetical protein